MPPKTIAFVTASCLTLPAYAAELWPVRPEASWTYEITNDGFSSVCAPGMFTEVIHTVEETDEGIVFTATSPCGYDYTMRVDEGRYYGTYADEWWMFLDRPEDGHTYAGFRSLMRYTAVPSIEVPAGTFENCWQVTQLVAYTQVWTYCPGVGKVWEKHIDRSGTGWEMKLVAYDLGTPY